MKPLAGSEVFDQVEFRSLEDVPCPRLHVRSLGHVAGQELPERSGRRGRFDQPNGRELLAELVADLGEPDGCLLVQGQAGQLGRQQSLDMQLDRESCLAGCLTQEDTLPPALTVHKLDDLAAVLSATDAGHDAPVMKQKSPRPACQGIRSKA
ncbi:MAG: hypothetical protein KDA75_12190 [Planctomycetaceae bacterium]|nr:hypothetical protein [Planctomycetaceae bacterium]